MKTYLPVFTLFIASACNLQKGQSQSIASFTSIEPTAQSQNFVIPGTHTFQRIIKTGTPLSSGGTLGSNLDFTGYVPIAGSSANGYLSISSETAPAECAILSINYSNSNKLWSVLSGGKVNLPTGDIGGCATFCSGTVTPRNTIMVCEETAPDGDTNGDGYDDLGWIIEIDPATRTVINQDGAGGVDKLWAMGRQTHENVSIKGDQSVAYWGADNGTTGFIYKFVPLTPGNFSAGTLYVLETTAALGGGTWKVVANTTKAERNTVAASSIAAGAYNFQRVEDVEIGPDGKVYFASTTTGRIYRFTDQGTTVNNIEVFVESTTYDVDGTGPFAAAKFEWPDNLAFDGEGNLWVLQDGGDNHIWVVSPAHTAAVPAIRVFANAPAGAEPTGITFSPDYKFMFISLQHPNGSNTATQTDAAGDAIVFNESTTLVVARKENLGATILPLRNIALNLLQKDNAVEVNWMTVGVNANNVYDVERSTDGFNFVKIGSQHSSFSNNASYAFTDNNLPAANNFYYRIKQCMANSACVYSEIKSVKVNPLKSLKVSSLRPGNVIRVSYTTNSAADVLVYVYTSNGKDVYREKVKVAQGLNEFNIIIDNLLSGMYILKIVDGGISESKSFLK